MLRHNIRKVAPFLPLTEVEFITIANLWWEVSRLMKYIYVYDAMARRSTPELGDRNDTARSLTDNTTGV